MMTGTNDSLYALIDEIRRVYETGYQDEINLLKPVDNLLSQVSDNLYSKEFHFILELIQNAVDSSRQRSGASQPVKVRFHLNQKDRTLIVANNGEPFSSTDVKRICGQLNQRKGPKKIGYKGIGFKSVVQITHNPQIYSPGCQFEFNQSFYPEYPYAWLIVPHWIPVEQKPEFLDYDWVTFVLPFRADLEPEGITHLSTELDDPSPELLLFLENLEHLEIRDDYSQKMLQLRKQIDRAGLTVVERHLADADTAWEVIGRWIITRHQPQKPLPAEAVKDYETRRGLKARDDQEHIDISDTRIALAFAVDEKVNFVDQEGLLFAFFPIAKQKSGLRFAIQADFLTTAGRETLVNSSPWNDWLLSNLPDAIEAGIGILKQRPEWQTILYEALPLEGEGQLLEGPQKTSFKAVATEVLGRLRQSPIVLTDLPGDEAWILPQEAVWLPPTLHPLLTNDDLPQLQAGMKAFVSFNIKSGRAKEFLTSPKGLAVSQIGNLELLAFLHNTDWIQSKPMAWFAALFNHFATIKLDENQRKRLCSLKLVPTTAGLAQVDEGIFLPPEDENYLRLTGTRFVHPEVWADLNAKGIDFVKNILKIEEVTYDGLIKNVIIRRLNPSKNNLTEAVLEEYVEFVYAYFENTAEETREKSLRNNLYQFLRLKAADGSWQPAAQLCLPFDEQNKRTLAGYLLEGAPAGYFVKLPEAERRSKWVTFYRWLGVHVQPPLRCLQKAMSNPAWFSNKPAIWFRVLFTYLEPQVDKSNFDRSLELIPVEQEDGTLKLYAAAPTLYFQTEGIDLKALGDVFAEDHISFVYSAVLSGESEQSAFPADPVRARHFLEKLGISELSPDTIIRRLIVKRFKASSETGVYPPQLIGYTIFAFETFRERKNLATVTAWIDFKAVVRLQATDGSWKRPDDLYLTKSYDAHDFETMLKGFWGVRFLSDTYLKPSAAETPSEKQLQEKWRRFMIDLGVRDQLKLDISHSSLNVKWDFSYKFSDFQEYFNALIKTDGGDVLRRYERHRITHHAEIEWLKRIIDTRSADRLKILLNILADFWAGESGYGSHLRVKYEYKWRGIWRGADYSKPSYFAWLLQLNPVLPTNNGLKSRSDWVFRDTAEIRQLVGDSVSYLSFKPKQNQKALLSDLLDVKWDVDSIPCYWVYNNLRSLKENNTATGEQCAAIYQFLVKKEDIAELEEEDLIFLTTPTRNWWKPSELFWTDYSSEFGTLRGYVSKEPLYQGLFTTFQKMGVNTEQPQPKDWADFLLDVNQDDDQTRHIIWRAYQRLEEFWRQEPEEPDWWADFAESAMLLTENTGYVSVSDGLYLADDRIRYQQLKDDLPFIWLPDSYRLVENLLTKLGLRRISDSCWVKVNVQPGQAVDTVIADNIRTEIIAHRPYIRSILVYKHPAAERDFEPFLALLDETSLLRVGVVENLEVQLQVTDRPEIAQAVADQHLAFYAPEVKTLYILASEARNLEIIGRGTATIFERFEESLRSELMLLFTRKSPSAKRHLLEYTLGIPLSEPLLNEPPAEDKTKTDSASAEQTPEKTDEQKEEATKSGNEGNLTPAKEEFEDEPEIEEIEFTPKSRREIQAGPRIIKKPSGGPREPRQPTEGKAETEEDKRKKIGKQGEKIALEKFKDDLLSKYPQAEVEETTSSFKMTLNGEIIAEIEWIDESEGEMIGYDISVTEGTVKKYYEVKATNSEAKETFPMSRRQWSKAEEEGDSYYILRIYNVGARHVKMKKVRNPYERWQDGELTAYPIQIEL